MNDPKMRKKLMWAAILCGGLLVSLVFISTLAPTSPGEPSNPVLRPGESTQTALQDTPAEETAADESTGGFSLGGGQLFSLAWRLLLVVGIIAVSIAGLRWWGRKQQGPKSSTGFLRVLDTLAISNGRSIHLVALGDRVIAIGATAQQLTLLNELSDAEAHRVMDDSATPDDAPISQFASHLFEQMKRTTGRSAPPQSETVIGNG